MKEVKPVQEQKATTTTTGKGKQQATKHAGAGPAVGGRKISYCDCCCVRYYDLKKVRSAVLMLIANKC